MKLLGVGAGPAGNAAAPFSAVVLTSLITISSTAGVTAAATPALKTRDETLLPPEPAFIGNPHPQPTYNPSIADIDAARESAKPMAPFVSNVKGQGFDRIVQIWLENQDFEKTANDPSFQFFATKGLLLTNYHGVTHPSQPNYAAAVSGDHFGMDHDEFFTFPPNVSTVVDLLDTRAISWGEYQEHLPYTGFMGMNYSLWLDDEASHPDHHGHHKFDFGKDEHGNMLVPPDYVRKHNPLIMFESVTGNVTRLRNIKNLQAFQEDVGKKQLPQWSFLTPNMTNDAHDTNITFAGKWLRGFLEPLLENKYFTDRTLIVVTFDENEEYAIPNRLYTLLLGDVVPPSLQGTHDTTYYNHYSLLSTVSLNWGLPSLGRWDCDANVLPPLSTILSYPNTNLPDALLPSTTQPYLKDPNPKKYELDASQIPHWNMSYPGPASSERFTPGWWPVPNTLARCASGLGILDKVKQTWGSNSAGTYNYTSAYPLHHSFNGAGFPAHITVSDTSDIAKNEKGKDVKQTATSVTGDGPLQPIDGAMDRGFSYHRGNPNPNGNDDGNGDGNGNGNGEPHGKGHHSGAGAIKHKLGWVISSQLVLMAGIVLLL